MARQFYWQPTAIPNSLAKSSKPEVFVISCKEQGLMSRDQNCFILKHFGDKKKLAILTSKKKQSMAMKYHLKHPLKRKNDALDVQNEAKRLLKRNKTAHFCTVTELSHIYQSWLGKSPFCCLNQNKATKFWC